MNRALSGLEPSLIRELNARKRPGDLDLGLGEPVLPPAPQPLQAATAWLLEHGCRYSPNLGFPEVREMVGHYLGCPGAQVCLTHGSQEALYLAVRCALNPGDEVLLVEPAYPAYAKIAQMEGLLCRTVALDPEQGFAPDAERVLAALTAQTRMLVLASPNNPSARVWPARELARLKEGLGDRWLLWDEVYRELYYTSEPPARPGGNRTLTVGGLSKCAALTGLRLGWLAAPPELVPLVLRAHQLLTTAASTFAQRVALELLSRPGLVQAHRPLYLQRRTSLLKALQGLDFVEPEGAFYCMLRLPPGRPSLPTALELLETRRVVTVPGVAFGAEGWLRLSWAGEPGEVAEGVRRIREGLG